METLLEAIRTLGEMNAAWEGGNDILVDTLYLGGSDESVLQCGIGRCRERTDDPDQNERKVDRQAAGQERLFSLSLPFCFFFIFLFGEIRIYSFE